MLGLAFLRSHWRLLAVAILLAALAFAWNSRSGWKQAAGSWRETAVSWRTAFATQKAAFAAAEAAARAKAEAQKIRTESRFRTLAERADHADEEIADLRAAAARFAGANRLRAPARAAEAGAGRTAAAAQGDAAPSDRRSGDDAIVVPRGDFDVLVENTIRLKQAHDWGESLIAEGLATKPEGD